MSKHILSNASTTLPSCSGLVISFNREYYRVLMAPTGTLDRALFPSKIVSASSTPRQSVPRRGLHSNVLEYLRLQEISGDGWDAYLFTRKHWSLIQRVSIAGAF